MVAADLVVAVFLRCTLREIQPGEQCVLAEASPQVDDGLLTAMFAFESLRLGTSALGHLGGVSEQIRRRSRGGLRRYGGSRKQVIDTESEATHAQCGVGDASEECLRVLAYDARR